MPRADTKLRGLLSKLLRDFVRRPSELVSFALDRSSRRADVGSLVATELELSTPRVDVATSRRCRTTMPELRIAPTSASARGAQCLSSPGASRSARKIDGRRAVLLNQLQSRAAIADVVLHPSAQRRKDRRTKSDGAHDARVGRVGENVVRIRRAIGRGGTCRGHHRTGGCSPAREGLARDREVRSLPLEQSQKLSEVVTLAS